MVYTTRENTLDRGAVTKSRRSGIFPGYHEPEPPKRKRTSLLYNSPHVSRVYSATQHYDVSDSPVAWPTRNGSHKHNVHVQRFQDSNERTDKNPWFGLRRVSVKRGIGFYLFLKNAVLGLGLGLTLTLTLTLTLILNLTLTLTLNNPNLTITLTLRQHSLKKKKDRPRPRPRVLLTPVCEENCGRGQARSLWRFFFLPKSALFCDKISDVVIFGRRSFNGSREKWILLRWDIFMLCDAPRLFLLFLDFHFILEVVVPQDDNRNCWRMLKTTEHHSSSSARIKVALTTDSRPKPPSLSYPAFQCISVHGV